MAIDFDGSTDGYSIAHSHADSPIDATDRPTTVACWFKQDADTNSYGVLVNTCDDTSTSYAEGLWTNTNTSSRLLLACSFSVGFNFSQSPSNISFGTWHHGAGVFASTTSRTCYLDGSAGTENTSSREPGNVDYHSIGHQNGTTNARFFDGKIAEVAVWWAALRADEIAALAAGYSPALIRPGALYSYMPLGGPMSSGPAVDIYWGRTLDVIGTPTASDHPPGMIYPADLQVIRPSAAPPAGVAPTGALYGPLVGPMGGPV